MYSNTLSVFPDGSLWFALDGLYIIFFIILFSLAASNFASIHWHLSSVLLHRVIPYLPKIFLYFFIKNHICLLCRLLLIPCYWYQVSPRKPIWDFYPNLLRKISISLYRSIICIFLYNFNLFFITSSTTSSKCWNHFFVRYEFCLFLYFIFGPRAFLSIFLSLVLMVRTTFSTINHVYCLCIINAFGFIIIWKGLNFEDTVYLTNNLSVLRQIIDSRKTIREQEFIIIKKTKI